MISALVLGYLYYKELNPGDKITQKTRVTLQSDERKLLQVNPPTNSTELLHFTSKVSQISKDSSTLTITGCTPQPLSIRLRNTKNVSVRNDDSTSHIIILDEIPYSIPAEKTVNVAFDFKKGGGVYPYKCDKTPHAVGFILYSE